MTGPKIMSVTIKDVEKIAKLAKLKFTEEEKTTLKATTPKIVQALKDK